MSDNKQQVHAIHFGPKLAEASRTEQNRAITSLIQDWRRSHGGGPEFVEHKGAKPEEVVLTVKGALTGELLAASLRGFSHKRVEDRPAVVAATSVSHHAPAPIA